MHRPALAGPQWRTIGAGSARTRTLENRLAWHGTSRSWTHRGSRGHTRLACGRGGTQGRLIDRTRPGLRNDHAWRRGDRGWRCTRGCRPGGHGGRLRWRHHGPWRGHGWRCGTSRRPRCRNRRSYRSWRSRGHWCGGLSNRWGRRSRKAWPRGRSRNHKFWRSGRRRHRGLRSGNARDGRGWRHGVPGLNRRRGLGGRGPMLLADDGF